jgi:hypothetical protein
MVNAEWLISNLLGKTAIFATQTLLICRLLSQLYIPCRMRWLDKMTTMSNKPAN